MGAWIEICKNTATNVVKDVAPFMGAWIEIIDTNNNKI